MGAVMSGYLETPVTEKHVEDGVSKLGLRYGASCMQGWRVANEDAMNCEPELTEDSALFGVYDGHGGPEVALYVAKYLPALLKTQPQFSEGKIDLALKEAFMAIDKRVVLEETVDELQTLAGTKADDEEEDMDEKMKECAELNEEADMPLTDLLAKYKEKFRALAVEEAEENGEGFEGAGKGRKEKVEVPDVLPEGAAAVVNGGASKAGGEDEGSVNGGPSKPEEEGEEKVEEGEGKEKGEEEKESKEKVEEGESKEKENKESKEKVDDEEEDIEEDSDYSEEEEEESGDEEEDSEEESGSGSEDEEDIPPDFDDREGYGSGTTACVAVLKNHTIVVANVGDSRCVVSCAGTAKDLSVDHKPESEEEKGRVERAGGKITGDGRVNGGLNLSRAIGDHQYKQNEELGPEEQMISPMPDITTHNISPDDEFLIIACDGIWNVMKSEEAVQFVSEHIKEYKASEKCVTTWLSDIAGLLLDQCLAPDTSGDGTGCDNMTCVIVLLNQDTSEEVRKRKLADSESDQDCKKTKIN